MRLASSLHGREANGSKRVEEVRTRSSLSFGVWLAGVVAVALVIGLGAWVVVSLLLSESAEDPASPIVGGLEFEPTPQGRPPEPDVARETGTANDREEVPAPDADEQRRVPVVWLSSPEGADDSGFEVQLRAGTERFTATLHEDHLLIPQDLSAGTYHLISSADLHFPATHHGRQLVVVADDEAYPRFVSPAQELAAIHVFHTIPIRVVADIQDEAEATVQVLLAGDWLNREDGWFFTRQLELRHQTEAEVNVPNLPLAFTPDTGGGPIRPDSITSSIGARAPTAGELVRLTLHGKATLEVELHEQEPGGLAAQLGPDVPRLSVGLLNWDTAGRQPLDADWARAPSSDQVGGLLTLSLPLLQTDSLVGLTVRIAMPDRIRGGDRQIIAMGEAHLRAGESAYRVRLEVMRYDWRLHIRVTDTGGAPWPDFAVEVSGYMRSGNTSRSLGVSSESRTDADGYIRVENLPAAEGVQLHLRPEVRPDRTLNPDFEHRIDFDRDARDAHERGEVITIELVYPLSIGRRLIFEFEQPPNTQETRNTDVVYALMPDKANDELHGDVGTVRMTDDRVYSEARAFGRYRALLFHSTYGEFLMEVEYRSSDANIVEVRPETPVMVRVTHTDAEGNPVSGTRIFTSGIDAPSIWGMMIAYRQPGTSAMGRRTTRAHDGAAEFPCQPGHLNPDRWLLYHPEHGVYRPREITGSPDEGYELRGIQPVAGGAVRVSLAASEIREGSTYHAIISPVYTEQAGKVTGVFAALGRLKVLPAEGWETSGLPVGTYAVSVLEKSDDGPPRSMGSAYTRIIHVSSDSTVPVQFGGD
jgi:hypothetical protein